MEEDDIRDSCSEDDSTDDEMDSNYDPNDEHDDYSSNEDKQNGAIQGQIETTQRAQVYCIS